MSTDPRDDIYMLLALEEAKKGEGRTAPNPCVGAIIVKDGRICGRGYHHQAGTPHAEIHALRDAGDAAAHATLYVTLEPCCHTGRTGPCSHAIVEAGISRVVVGMGDPNPQVNGGGISYLREHGVAVTCFVQEERCKSLNRAFLKYITQGLPLITLKAGMSMDGRISAQPGKPIAITGQQSLRKLHEMRNRYDAILVGSNTVVADNPSLTTRLIKDGRDPIRVVLDSHLKTLPSSTIYHLSSSAPTLVFCLDSCSTEKRMRLQSAASVEVISLPANTQNQLDLLKVCQVLAERGCLSVLVEGGGQVFGSFLAKHLADDVAFFCAPLLLGSQGTPLLAGFFTQQREDVVQVVSCKTTRLGADMLVQGNLIYPDSRSTGK